ncbi:MAG TPA: LLM class flavin-dependent oxidoreductase [Stellaceae bacterium]|jgi:hypothetical protein|nr:LLM class flavin-dependent oxidoreductase [Stellaceae bacterium]
MATAADRFGFDMIGIADTPGNAMDPWVAATIVAGVTERVRMAICVSNLVSRHPAVSAWSARLSAPPIGLTGWPPNSRLGLPRRGGAPRA